MTNIDDSRLLGALEWCISTWRIGAGNVYLLACTRGREEETSMSGSSKSKNIKHRKDAQDSKRARHFARLAKDIMTAVKQGGDDPGTNPSLRLAIQQARDANMPKANIERAQHKNSQDEDNTQTLLYEAYCVDGVALLCKCVTDNPKRTVAMFRNQLRKQGASLAKAGAVQHIFETKGQFRISQSFDTKEDEELFLLEMIEAGVEDFQSQDGVVTLSSAAEAFGRVERLLQTMDVTLQSASIETKASSTVELDRVALQKLHTWLHKLRQEEDVQEVHHNAVLAKERSGKS